MEYGTSTGYGQLTALDPTLTISHAVALSGLSPGVTYRYRVKSHKIARNGPEGVKWSPGDVQ